MNYPALPKRKRSEVESEEARDSSFQLENLSSSSILTFEHVARLLRAHVPLSWLSSTSQHNLLPNGSILQGTINYVTSWEYAVLVARNVPNGGLYALEKVDQDVFICQPLQPFVTDKWIQDASIGAIPPVSLQMMLHYVPESLAVIPKHDRRTPSLSSIPDFKIPKNRRGMAARLSILGEDGKQETPCASPTLLGPASNDTAQPDEHESGLCISELAVQDKSKSKVEPLVTQPVDAIAIDETIATQDMLAPEYLSQRYLEHLYKSKESIAYYAKGPLSRARARARAANASVTLQNLADFYRESILPAKKWEVKFKESLPHTIMSGISELRGDSDEQASRKKANRRKTKLGKDGLWPIENDYIVRWWQARSVQSIPIEDQEAKIRDAVSKSLRMREAQMQIVLMLEILAIESKLLKPATGELDRAALTAPADVETKVESIESDKPLLVPGKAERTIKKRNLETDLEVLADKLCIWHSIGVEFAFSDMLGDESIYDENTEDPELSKDTLRNFCTDVLIPFYNSKLPLLCKSLCKTLAGPDVYGQSQKAARIKSNVVQMKPGAQTVRERPQSRSRTLDRMLDGDGTRPTSPADTFRSPTLPPVPSFKREPSDFSQRSLSRQNSVSFTNREVDLDADAQATAAKKRKLDRVASQKQELAAAIQALKKPNRQGLGRAFMDEVENRQVERRQPVLITATPRANRRKTIGDVPVGSDKHPLATEDIIVPSSSVKPISMPTSFSSNKKKAVLAAMHETRLHNAVQDTMAMQLSSRLNVPRDTGTAVGAHSSSSVLATPSKSRTINMVFSTPTKRVSSGSAGKENMFQLPTEAIKTMNRAMNMPVEDSIYDMLGWNDNDEI